MRLVIRAKLWCICIMRRQAGVHNTANRLFILPFYPCLFALLYFPHLLHFPDYYFLFSICRCTFTYLPDLSCFIRSTSLPLHGPGSSSHSSSLLWCPSCLPHPLLPYNPFSMLSSLFLICVLKNAPSFQSLVLLPRSFSLLPPFLFSRALQCRCVGDDVRDAAAGVSNGCVYIRVLQPCGLQPLSGWRQRWDAPAQHTWKHASRWRTDTSWG